MSYTEAQKAEAIGLGLAVGAYEAARRTGVPRRSISRWLASGQAVPIRAQSQQDVAAKLWEAVVAGTDAVLAGLRDPKARLSDKAQALRVVAEQHALLTGGSTSNNFNLNATVAAPALTPEEDEQLLQFIHSIERSTDAELEEWAASGGLRKIAKSAVDG